MVEMVDLKQKETMSESAANFGCQRQTRERVRYLPFQKRLFANVWPAVSEGAGEVHT